MAGNVNNVAVWSEADVLIGPLTAVTPADGVDFSLVGADAWAFAGILDGAAGFGETQSSTSTPHYGWGFGEIATTRKDLTISRTFTALEDNAQTMSLRYDTSGVTFAGTLAAPVLAAPTTATTGGSLAASTYYYKVTALNAAGETVGSNQVSQITTGATSTVGLSWAAIAGATGYKVYRSTTTNGQSTSPALVATLGAVTAYTDTGTAVSAGAVPATNTATGATYSGELAGRDLQGKFRMAFETRTGTTIRRYITKAFAQIDSLGDVSENEDNLAQLPVTVKIYPEIVNGQPVYWEVYKGPAVTP